MKMQKSIIIIVLKLNKMKIKEKGKTKINKMLINQKNLLIVIFI